MLGLFAPPSRAMRHIHNDAAPLALVRWSTRRLPVRQAEANNWRGMLFGGACLQAMSPGVAIIVATLVAGVLDIAAVFAFWLSRGVPPDAILRSIATSVLGEAAMSGGAAALGLALHVFVSFVFAAAYVIAALRLPVLKQRPVTFGLLYGALAYVIMTLGVVPLSLATFGQSWPPPLLNLAASVSIHLFLFGLPIALVTSRMRGAIATAEAAQSAS